jgi:hypothetical protein
VDVAFPLGKNVTLVDVREGDPAETDVLPVAAAEVGKAEKLPDGGEDTGKLVVPFPELLTGDTAEDGTLVASCETLTTVEFSADGLVSVEISVVVG